MTLDTEQLKKRRLVMMIVNVLAAIGAVASILAFFQLDYGWALFTFIGALLAGFGAQIWFIMGLRGHGKDA